MCSRTAPRGIGALRDSCGVVAPAKTQWSEAVVHPSQTMTKSPSASTATSGLNWWFAVNVVTWNVSPCGTRGIVALRGDALVLRAFKVAGPRDDEAPAGVHRG